MPDAPERHRQSIRLRGYNDTTAGAYFVTICTQHRSCLLGDAETAAITIAGEMIASWWLALPTGFFAITLDTFVIMPNHLHGIIWLPSDLGVGADRRVRLAGASDPVRASDDSLLPE
jgi:REP element-mobilizing transposase RayT